MNEHIEFSAATSIFCRVMQVVVLAAIGLFLYYGYFQADANQSSQLAAYYLGFLTQDQQNLVIESEAKFNLLTRAVAAFSITTVVLLLGIFRVFGRFASRPFDLVKALRTIRFLGLMFILKAIIDFLEHPAMLYLWTYDNPPEYRAMATGFDIQGLASLTQLSIFLIGLALMIGGNLAVSAVRRGAAAIEGIYAAEEILEDAEEDLEEAEEELAEAEAELEEAQEELAEGEAKLEAADSPEEVVEAIEQIEEAKEDIVDAQDEIEEARAEIAEAVEEIAEAEAQIEDLQKTLTPGEPEKTS